MSLITFLNDNYPILVDFLGNDYICNLFNPLEEILKSDNSVEDKPIILTDEKSLKKERCFETESENDVLKDIVLHSYFSTAKSEVTDKILQMLDKNIENIKQKIQDTKFRSIKQKIKDPNNIIQAIYEIYATNILSNIAIGIDIEVANPDRPQNNFDIQANIDNELLNIEVTTRRDQFPYETDGVASRSTISRAFQDHRESNTNNNINYDSIPESDDLRRKLLDKAVRQLPKNGINIMAVGYIQGASPEYYVDCALNGDIKYAIIKDYETLKSWDTLIRNRVSNGLFCDEEGNFKNISAVVLISPISNDGFIWINPSKNLSENIKNCLLNEFNLKTYDEKK